jgi:hypothetical protein
MSLVDTLKLLGYDNDSIRTITQAAEVAEVERISASRRDLTQLLTPVQAAAQSSRHAAQLKQLDGMISHASGCKYRLPKDGRHVDPFEVDKAISSASIETRMHIKSGLRALGLIPA